MIDPIINSWEVYQGVEINPVTIVDTEEKLWEIFGRLDTKPYFRQLLAHQEWLDAFSRELYIVRVPD
jgi:hypothetical protein